MPHSGVASCGVGPPAARRGSEPRPRTDAPRGGRPGRHPTIAHAASARARCDTGSLVSPRAANGPPAQTPRPTSSPATRAEPTNHAHSDPRAPGTGSPHASAPRLHASAPRAHRDDRPTSPPAAHDATSPPPPWPADSSVLSPTAPPPTARPPTRQPDPAARHPGSAGRDVRAQGSPRRTAPSTSTPAQPPTSSPDSPTTRDPPAHPLARPSARSPGRSPGRPPARPPRAPRPGHGGWLRAHGRALRTTITSHQHNGPGRHHGGFIHNHLCPALATGTCGRSPAKPTAGIIPSEHRPRPDEHLRTLALESLTDSPSSDTGEQRRTQHDERESPRDSTARASITGRRTTPEGEGGAVRTVQPTA